MSGRGRGDGWVTLIGVGKLLKTVALVTVGTVVLASHGDLADHLRRWSFSLGINPGSRPIAGALGKIAGLDDHALKMIAIVAFAYAALFALEATGLLLHKRWGEWVTIVITGSFIPLEVFETVKHPHVGRAITIVLNVAAVAYLVWRVRTKDGRGHKESKRRGPVDERRGARESYA